jgi:hypothetical protein
MRFSTYSPEFNFHLHYACHKPSHINLHDLKSKQYAAKNDRIKIETTSYHIRMLAFAVMTLSSPEHMPIRQTLAKFTYCCMQLKYFGTC